MFTRVAFVVKNSPLAMPLQINFKYHNTLESAVGAEGLRASDLDASLGKDLVAAFRRRVDSGDIGFPSLPDDRQTARAISEFALDLRPSIDNVLLLGIGGSALGAYALDVAMRGPHPVQSLATGHSRKPRRSHAATPRLVVLDNVDPGVMAAALEQLNPKRTAVCVIAKSGTTAETLAAFLI